MVDSLGGYECKFCLKSFKKEGNFMKHKCNEMKRHNELKGVRGQAGYKHYSTWMTAYNRKVPTIETFSTSRYFNAFLKFSDYVKSLNIPEPDRFIALMKNKDIDPTLWTRNECYSLYLEWNDKKSDPMDQAQITINTLYKLADAGEVEVCDVFSLMHPREIMQMIRLRKLSPWLLLCSSRFKECLQKMDEDDKAEMLEVIGYNYWATKFEKKPETVKQMKEIALALSI